MNPHEYLSIYLRQLEARGLRPDTIKGHERAVRYFIRWLGDGDLRNVTVNDLLTFYSEGLVANARDSSKPLCVTYRNANMFMVAEFFNTLFDLDYLLSNPASLLPAFPDWKVRLPRNILNAEQMLALLRKIPLHHPWGFRDRTMLELPYSTGLRGGELCRLTIYDIDFEESIVTVFQGKGRKDRMVPLGKVAREYLREYLERVRPILWKMNGGRRAVEKLFFTTRRSPMNLHALLRVVKKYHNAAGLPGEITTHSFRHACATEMLKGGASVRHVQEMLGHSSIETTQTYTRVVPIDLNAVHQKTAPSEANPSPSKPNFKKQVDRDWSNNKQLYRLAGKTSSK